jgi:hypothetical protein
MRKATVHGKILLIALAQAGIVGCFSIALHAQIMGSSGTRGTAPAADAMARTLLLENVAVVLGGGALAFEIGRRLTSRIRDVSDAFGKIFERCFPLVLGTLGAVSQGDLTARYVPVCKPIAARGSDEIAALATLHNRMLTEGFTSWRRVSVRVSSSSPQPCPALPRRRTDCATRAARCS